MKKIIALMIAVIMLCGAFIGCAKPDADKKDEKNDSSSENSGTNSGSNNSGTNSGSNNSGTGYATGSLSDYEWYDGVIVIDGVLYQVRTDPYSKYEENGWVLEVNDQEIENNHMAYVSFKNSKNGGRIRVSLYNNSGKSKKLSECTIMDITNNCSGDPVPFELPGGITRGSTLEQIKAAYGEPSDTRDSTEDNTIIVFYFNENSTIELNLYVSYEDGLQYFFIEDNNR